MSTQPLLFLGDKRRGALLARVAECTRRWRQQWAPRADDVFDATCEAPAAGGYTGSVASLVTSCWGLSVADERLAVLLLPHATFGWAVQEQGGLAAESVATAGSDSLAEQLEREVARTLLVEFCGVEERARVTVERLPAANLADWSRLARAWVLNVRAAANGRSFTVLVSAARIEALAPARGISRPNPLDSRRDAISDNSVSLRAVVGEASMSVNELAELALDDVLVLDQRLGETVTLVSPVSGTTVTTGNLGRSGARRAIKIAGPAASRN
jgi:flagellar motor switch/type III secretory pathway protein FliN